MRKRHHLKLSKYPIQGAPKEILNDTKNALSFVFRLTLEPLSDWSPWGGDYIHFPRGIPDFSYESPEGVIIWRFALEFMRE